MRSRIRNLALIPALLAWTTLTCAPAMGATNVATGIIGDGTTVFLSGGDGTGTATFTLESTPLALRKQARSGDGSVLPDNAPVLAGQEIYFVLWVDNPTDFRTASLTLIDQLNESQFEYVPGSLESTTVTSGADDAALWAGTWSALTDALDPATDEASIVDSGPDPGPDRLTVGSVPGQANLELTVAPQSVYAIRFRATVK